MITVDTPIVMPFIIATVTRRPTVRLRTNGAQDGDCCERADELHNVMLNARWTQVIRPDSPETA